MDNTVANVRVLQPEKTRAVSSVNFHGARQIRMEGRMNTIRKANTPTAAIPLEPPAHKRREAQIALFKVS